MTSPYRGLTVVVVARNAATTIDGALASIAAQSQAPEAVLVVDDASEDDTVPRARAWEPMLPITVHRLEANVGVGAARRFAMERVTTDVAATLDADDAWLPNHLALLAAAHADGVLSIASNYLWLPDGKLRPCPREVPSPTDQLQSIIRGNFASAGVLFSRADYQACGGYRAELRHGEDWDLYLRMIRREVRAVLAPQPTLLYRVSPDSLSSGYATVESDVRVLELALSEAATAGERRWIERSLGERRGRLALSRALVASRDGDARGARRQALTALRHGNAKTRRIGLGIIAAPELATRLRDLVSRRRWS